MAAGAYHTCVVMNGAIECFGWNDRGQLGNNTTKDSDVPVPVWGLTTGVQAIAAGYGHTCALVNGRVQCWGWNDYYQLGDGSRTDSSVPVSVQGL
jgi:alpha-tubulin suppressor-like RCC1 family protein